MERVDCGLPFAPFSLCTRSKYCQCNNECLLLLCALLTFDLFAPRRTLDSSLALQSSSLIRTLSLTRKLQVWPRTHLASSSFADFFHFHLSSLRLSTWLLTFWQCSCLQAIIIYRKKVVENYTIFDSILRLRELSLFLTSPCMIIYFSCTSSLHDC